MPVCIAANEQIHPIVIQSYPDKGYFIVWEDKRVGGFYGAYQVYAQKYDKDGNKLWATDGVVISSSTNNQHFTWSSNQDYRNRKVAASDKAGGLYITYIDDSIATYDWARICVQHMTAGGNTVFPGAGFVVAQTPSGQAYNFNEPQLITDNDNGFYVSYVQKGQYGDDWVYVYNLADQGGTIKSFGGGVMNENITNTVESDPCGGGHYILHETNSTVRDYNIWSDQQGNCSVIMSINGNTASQGNMLAYNKLWKAKQDITVDIKTIDPNFVPGDLFINYKKGDATTLYQARFNTFTRSCHTPTETYVITDRIVISNGFISLATGDYEYSNPKGVNVSTGGNINVETIATGIRVLNGNSVSNSVTLGIGFRDEIYPAVPYQRADNNFYGFGYNTAVPAGLDTFYTFRDTIMPASIFPYDFSIAGGGKQIFAAALATEVVTGSNSPRALYLQHFGIEDLGGGKYDFKFYAPVQTGLKIGKEVSTGFSGSDIFYDFPLLNVNNTGNALFYINELGRYTRVSPIQKDAQLAWGAMGKPIGTPQYASGYIYPTAPAAALDSTDGTGVVTWYDLRNLGLDGSDNIFMRHLDSLNVTSYTPPNKKLQQQLNGLSFALPSDLLGSSMKYSPIEGFNTTTGTVSPLVEILDNYNLGAVPVSVFENVGPIRLNNGKPYLDRNFTITPERNPAGAADINVRLYFTNAEFDALKAADPGITSPASLSVIKQPSVGSAPATYIISGSETEITPIAWAAVDGGYYVEIKINSFSNFFIQKASSALPVTWLGVQAQWTDANNAKISWQVADQLNVKDYTVQQSNDGLVFTNACKVTASALTNYTCNTAATPNAVNYFRVLQRDLDNKFTYSKTVLLRSTAAISLAVHPNPVKDRLYVDGISNYRILQIADMSGKIMQEENVVSGLKYINIAQLSPGIYFLTAKGDQATQTLKFVKQ